MSLHFNEQSSIDNVRMDAAAFVDGADCTTPSRGCTEVNFQSLSEILRQIDEIRVKDWNRTVRSEAREKFKKKLRNRPDLVSMLMQLSREKAVNYIAKAIWNGSRDVDRKAKSRQRNEKNAGKESRRQQFFKQQQELRSREHADRKEVLKSIFQGARSQGVTTEDIENYKWHVGDDMTYAEIATIRNSTVSTVSSRFYRVQAIIRRAARERYSEFLSE